MSNTDKWAEDILKAVAEAENGSNDNYEEVDFDFSKTRYKDSYEEALLADVY